MTKEMMIDDILCFIPSEFYLSEIVSDLGIKDKYQVAEHLSIIADRQSSNELDYDIAWTNGLQGISMSLTEASDPYFVEVHDAAFEIRRIIIDILNTFDINKLAYLYRKWGISHY